MSRVSVNVDNHIARVTLTRADKKNAMDQAMIDGIIDAAGTVAGSGARVVVLHGDGGTFCAGIDLNSLGSMIGSDMRELLVPRTHGGGTTNQWQEVVMAWRRLDIPVIAALKGSVFGAGMQLALGADIRIASPDAELAVMEMKWGIIPDMGGMVLLPGLVRDDVLRLLVYTAAPVSAAQAEAWGLVTSVDDDPLAAALALAGQIASNSPAAVQAAKQLMGSIGGMTPEQVLVAEAETQAGLLGTPEQMEVIAARFARRTPVFP
ncbi:crotonase/enoyl-CoA hydratase family protein [uncultured Roseobacter sp.]|uniref:crotonase/enoyl-CoA hydratase family protein n=1 Tax=uncultured Roseobacter sp. TaxID=114847 RepID=UPI00260CCD62|nr:crotonase/enoyl-CoA hydratase family protein [uncultured Roseobacter sp.]